MEKIKRFVFLWVLMVTFNSCTGKYSTLYNTIHYDFKSIKSYKQLYHVYESLGYKNIGTYYLQEFNKDLICFVNYDFLKERLFINFSTRSGKSISENSRNEIISILTKKYGKPRLGEIELSAFKRSENCIPENYKRILSCWQLGDRILYYYRGEPDLYYESYFCLIVLLSWDEDHIYGNVERNTASTGER